MTQKVDTTLISGLTIPTNVLINGAMAIDQRNAGAAQTITAGAALAYTVDRWYGYCTGANVTGQRVAGSGNTQYRYQFTGAASVTAIGFAQRIEAANSFHLAGSIATLSLDLANTLLTTVTWTAYYANTTDTFGTLATPTRTLIGTGTFTVNSTVTRYNTQITIPAATTGIEIVLSVGAQTSGTWTIGNVQLEPGRSNNNFWARSIGAELSLCQRYYYRLSGVKAVGAAYADSATNGYALVQFPVPMRTVPTAIEQSGTASHYTIVVGLSSIDCSAVPLYNNLTSEICARIQVTTASGLTNGYGGFFYLNTAAGYLGWEVEL